MEYVAHGINVSENSIRTETRQDVKKLKQIRLQINFMHFRIFAFLTIGNP